MRTKMNENSTKGNISVSVFAMPSDTNSQNTIFGGWLLSHMDLAGLVECKQYSPGRYVTVGIEQMKFLQPVLVGDLVKIYTNVHKTGKTSITIKLLAEANRLNGEDSFIVTEGLFTYVKTSSDGATTIPLK